MSDEKGVKLKEAGVLKNPVLLKGSEPTPRWARALIAAGAGGAFVLAGDEIAGKLSKDSPVHFAVEGAPPEVATDWACAPEGGIVGAPVVCRYVGAATGLKKADGEIAVDAASPLPAPAGVGDGPQGEAR